MRKISTFQILLLFFILINGLNLLTCGKRGPSLPPIKVIPATAHDIQARQIDDSIILRFMVPQKYTDGSSIQGSLSVSVLCSIEQAQAESSSSPSYENFLKRAKTCMIISPEELLQKTMNNIAHVEHHIFERYGEKAPGKRFSYAVQLTDEEGKLSALSRIASLICGKPLSAPTHLRAKVLEDGIRLSWRSQISEPAEKKDQLFNIYRLELFSSEESVDESADRDEKSSAGISEEQQIGLILEPINKQPVSEMTYLDGLIHFGKSYLYSVRSLHDDSDRYRESGNSNIFKIQPRDVFPPESPQGMTAVAEGPVIRLFWYPNTEKDLRGYRIYRSSERSGSFSIIAETPPHMTSYTDKEALPEKTWHYYLTAFDSAEPPNESPASPIISEIALPQFDRHGLKEEPKEENE